jgi:hypothetical protein
MDRYSLSKLFPTQFIDEAREHHFEGNSMQWIVGLLWAHRSGCQLSMAANQASAMAYKVSSLTASPSGTPLAAPKV